MNLTAKLELILPVQDRQSLSSDKVACSGHGEVQVPVIAGLWTKPRVRPPVRDLTNDQQFTVDKDSDFCWKVEESKWLKLAFGKSHRDGPREAFEGL